MYTLTQHSSVYRLLLKKSIFLFIFILSTPLLFSQISVNKQQQIDSLDLQLKNDSAYIYRFRKIRLFMNYQERNTIFTARPFNFFGPQVGIYFLEKQIIGICAYFSSPRTKATHVYSENGTDLLANNNIHYYTLLYQRIIYRERFFSLSIPVEFGYGNFNTKYTNTSTNLSYEKNRELFLFNIDLKGTIKPFKWLGFSGSFGYRNTNEEILDGVYYALGVWFGLKAMSNDINFMLKKRKRRKAVKKILET